MATYDTIVALATPPIPSALAIVRLSGQEALTIGQKLFDKPFSAFEKQAMMTGWLQLNGQPIDQVVLLIYKKPHSFTGEDVVEFISHGSPLIGQQIIDACVQLGARMAQAGEFSSRAFVHKKIDLIQAESIHDMIFASTPEAKQLALLSLKGETSALLTPIKTTIADVLALIEVNIDYPEYEDIEQVTHAKVEKTLTLLIEQINTLLTSGEKGRMIQEGVKVAIIGEPNVGKSSLLNALIGEEKAIVTSVPGTTRDVVEASLNLQGVRLHILDTAGLRESEDIVEKIGIEKSRKVMQEADLIVHLVIAGQTNTLPITSTKPVIKVYNKSDLHPDFYPHDGVLISALNKDLETLKQAIANTLGLQPIHFASPSLYQARHLNQLRRIKQHLTQALLDAEQKVSMDILSSSLQLAYDETVVLLGLDGKINLHDEIFSRFCVGK